MKNFMMIFTLFALYPMTLHAEDAINSNGIDTELFDELPINEQEIRSVTNVFWNAQSIQDGVKKDLPDSVKNRFSKADGCSVKAVIKTEPSVETCDLNDDPEKNAKFIYNFNVSCNFGNYQVSICSREQAKLLNQVKVKNPSKLVSDENPFDLDSTM